MSSLISSESILPTLTSTILSSSSCSSSVELVPSSFAYSNNTIVGKVPIESSSSERSTIYEYATVTDDDIYEVVQTVCDGFSNCYATTELESFTTYTATVDGILTVITTGVPYTDEPSEIDGTTTETEITTTLAETITATITSCDDVCHTTTETQVLTTETSTVDGVETIYTTYCPLSSKEDEATTVTDISSTVITITSCKDDKCKKVPVTTGLTTVTEDNTIYTTYCPLSSETTSSVEPTTTTPVEETTTTEICSTVITITSCKDNKCEEKPVTTGVTTVTEDNTIYTTYCPLSSETTTSEDTTLTVKKTTTSSEKPTTTTSKIVDVITDNIVTQTPTQSPTTVVQSVASSVTVPTASVFEGSANTVKTGFIAIMLSFALTLF